MTPADIAALDAAEKTATPKPWESSGVGEWLSLVSQEGYRQNLGAGYMPVQRVWFSDALFIVLARNLIRPLLDERQAMQKRIAELKSAFDDAIDVAKKNQVSWTKAEKRIAELEEIDQQYCRVNMELTHENAALHERIAELEAELNRLSRNRQTA